jgi:hypothetical protein
MKTTTYKVADLDKRICDCEPDMTNPQTYRQWIQEAYETIYGVVYSDQYLNSLTDEQITGLMNNEELEWLLLK